MGIVPVYVGSDNEGRFYVASEMKALTPVCDTVKEFPPGSYLYSKKIANSIVITNAIGWIR